MGHEIDMSNARENMVYVGDTPWHRLGTSFEGNEDFDQWRIAAGFDWEATERALFYKRSAGQFIDVPLPSHKALVRSDTGTVLGVVAFFFPLIRFIALARHCSASAREGRHRDAFTTPSREPEYYAKLMTLGVNIYNVFQLVPRLQSLYHGVGLCCFGKLNLNNMKLGC